MSNSSSNLPWLLSSSVSAGFPSPAGDHLEQRLDLNEHLIQHREATFFMRVEGDSMLGAGIHNGDLLVVDRSMQATNQKVVVAVVDGEFTVKRFVRKDSKVLLVAENENYRPIEITSEMDFQVWGVVTWVIHAL